MVTLTSVLTVFPFGLYAFHFFFPYGSIYLRKWNKEQPLTFSDYLKTPLKERGPGMTHSLSPICSSVLQLLVGDWHLGLRCSYRSDWLCHFVCLVPLPLRSRFAIGQSQSFVTSMWSLLYYKELNHATCKTWVFEVLMLLSYIISIAILFMAFYV